MPRKKPNPKLATLEQQAEKLTAACERHYQRLRAAFLALEKSRKDLASINEAIDAAIDDTLKETI